LWLFEEAEIRNLVPGLSGTSYLSNVIVTSFFLDDRMMRMPWRRRWSRSRK